MPQRRGCRCREPRTRKRVWFWIARQVQRLIVDLQRPDHGMAELVRPLSSTVGSRVLWVCRRLEASLAMTFPVDQSPNASRR